MAMTKFGSAQARPPLGFRAVAQYRGSARGVARPLCNAHLSAAAGNLARHFVYVVVFSSGKLQKQGGAGRTRHWMKPMLAFGDDGMTRDGREKKEGAS
jgi:hypothetical protein